MARILIKFHGGLIMRKAIIYIIIFAIVYFANESVIQNGLTKEINNQSPYYLSFASIGANLLESRLDCWAKIKTVNNNEEVDQKLLEILSHLNLPANQNEFLHRENEETTITQYDFTYNNQNYYFLLQTIKENNESYFLMTAINKKDDQQLRNDEKKLKELMDCKSYYLYKGVIDAQPDYSGQEELLNVVMKNLHAATDDIYHDNTVISMTGFSPLLERTQNSVVNVSGSKKNVQAAIRRSGEKTEVYLGFPLLLNDY
jgi:hypothetical protein